MERNLCGSQCKYRYEQQLNIKTINKNKEKYRRGLYSSFSSVHQQQFDSLKPDNQQKNFKLINVQEGETFIEDNDVVIDEAQDGAWYVGQHYVYGGYYMMFNNNYD
ncbi:unnamed protein product [Rotaria sordida]|uniref:Uncharacterized protein n=1 Tax=Rotaria sordida TaxID=392033 RepID=A0A819BR32_9BILA|nr:unnamed protein product [Rotaria sordida]CAF3806171.1 unnamed protein product [Rotaria sordida]CAF3857217.1 unnamed protein product [Rotaria sordida]